MGRLTAPAARWCPSGGQHLLSWALRARPALAHVPASPELSSGSLKMDSPVSPHPQQPSASEPSHRRATASGRWVRCPQAHPRARPVGDEGLSGSRRWGPEPFCFPVGDTLPSRRGARSLPAGSEVDGRAGVSSVYPSPSLLTLGLLLVPCGSSGEGGGHLWGPLALDLSDPVSLRLPRGILRGACCAEAEA